MNVLAYQPKTAGAQATESLIGKISYAGDQWKGLGTALTISFKEAYKIHEKTLKLVEERFKTENSNLMYYLFAAFVAGAVGGGVGLLIAPVASRLAGAVATGIASRVSKRFGEKRWIAETMDARRRIQETAQRNAINAKELGVKGTEEVGVKAVEKLEIDKFLAAAQETPVPGDPNVFKPPQIDPHQFDLDRRHEIDLCVSQLKEYVKRFQIAADHFQWGTDAANAFTEMMIAEDFIQKQPGEKEIAAAAGEEKRKLAELGMWIAWAKGRKIEYWRTRLLAVREIDRGADYNDYIELRRLDPIIERLKILKVDNLATMPFKVTDRAFTHLVKKRDPVLNVLALAGIGSTLGDPYLRSVSRIANGKILSKDMFKF